MTKTRQIVLILGLSFMLLMAVGCSEETGLQEDLDSHSESILEVEVQEEMPEEEGTEVEFNLYEGDIEGEPEKTVVKKEDLGEATFEGVGSGEKTVVVELEADGIKMVEGKGSKELFSNSAEPAELTIKLDDTSQKEEFSSLWGSGNKNPVIFVHGYLDKTEGLDKSFFNEMISYLDSQGWNSHELHTIQYSNVIGCNINNAHELQDFINNLGYSEVDIVAHSMGGLSTRYYLQNMGGHQNVGSVVTLGTPHDGTVTSYFGPGEGANQMHYGSDFLNDLNSGDITPGDVSYTSIYTYADEVVPWWRSRPDGWHLIGGWYSMHITMVSNDSVIEHVKNNLTQ